MLLLGDTPRPPSLTVSVDDAPLDVLVLARSTCRLVDGMPTVKGLGDEDDDDDDLFSRSSYPPLSAAPASSDPEKEKDVENVRREDAVAAVDARNRSSQSPLGLPLINVIHGDGSG